MEPEVNDLCERSGDHEVVMSQVIVWRHELNDLHIAMIYDRVTSVDMGLWTYCVLFNNNNSIFEYIMHIYASLRVHTNHNMGIACLV